LEGYTLASESLFPTRRAGGEGILPSQELRDFVSTGIVSATHDVLDEQIQPASIDLRLSNRAHRILASFLPSKSTTLLNKATSNGMLIQTLDISSPTLLEPKVIYIIPLMESLALPQDVYGIANPKSTTGRLDIFTRLITEHGDEFERVGKGYSGRLYIEVVSQTFPIIIRAGMRLNQLRFARGRVSATGDKVLRQLDENSLLIADEERGQATVDRGVRITVDLLGNGSGVVAYQAKEKCPPVDLSCINQYEVADFWIPIPRSPKSQLILEPSHFYILTSKQKLRVPPDRAAEMLPYDLSTQEFRVHYAGFFDPGFGYGAKGEIAGTKAVLEVRASELPILLEDDQLVGRLNYFAMADLPDKVYGGNIGSSYQQQGLTLAKQFRRDEQFVSSDPHPLQNKPTPEQSRLQSVMEAMQHEEDDEPAAGSLQRAGIPNEQWVTARKRDS
jgi:dCTP deaminase